VLLYRTEQEGVATPEQAALTEYAEQQSGQMIVINFTRA